jgi:hypothetical protein
MPAASRVKAATIQKLTQELLTRRFKSGYIGNVQRHIARGDVCSVLHGGARATGRRDRHKAAIASERMDGARKPRLAGSRLTADQHRKLRGRRPPCEHDRLLGKEGV